MREKKSRCEKCGKEAYFPFYATMCYSCREKEELRLIKDAIQSGDETSIYFDTDSDDYIICPYCGNAFEADYSDGWENGEKYTCYECDKEFEIGVEYSVSFSTRKVDE